MKKNRIKSHKNTKKAENFVDTSLTNSTDCDTIHVRRKGGQSKMAVSVARVKPLEGKDAERFWTALKTSKVRKEAIDKAKKCCTKGFNSK